MIEVFEIKIIFLPHFFKFSSLRYSLEGVFLSNDGKEKGVKKKAPASTVKPIIRSPSQN